jgi:hypothetical protein
MRKLTFALAIALLAAGSLSFAGAGTAAAVTTATKVVIVVGQTQGATGGYINDANSLASVFNSQNSGAHPVSVTTVYSPHATWAAVKAAAKDANIFVYMGHGNGYPNPYVRYLQPSGDNGIGLDGPTAGKTYYYGESYVAQLDLAPNALVMLNHLCYASGNSEGGRAKLDHLTVAMAHTRIDGYGAGFIRAGAKAVIAEGLNDLSYYVNTLFSGGSMTVDQMWRNAPRANGNVVSYTSSRTPGYTSESDPDSVAHSDGDVYYRSMVSIPSLTMNQIIGSHATPFVSQSGKYHAMTPARVVDSRYGTVGPTGLLLSRSVYKYQISGVNGVPANAISVTANVTVTEQTSSGWMYLGPTIEATPTSSTINFLRGDVRANGITIGLAPDGSVEVYYGAAANNTIHVIVDVTGYFLPGTSGAGYVAAGPTRVLDTRTGAGNFGLQGQFLNAQHRTIQIAGVKGLPASGIVAMTGTLTVVHPSAAGYVSLGPDPTNAPTFSTINFPANDIRANNIVVPVNPNGTVSAVFMARSGGVDLVLDISGYFTASGGASFTNLNPVRILDSRTGQGGITGPFPANTARTLDVVGANVGVPSGAAAITGILTVTAQTSGGFAAVGPTIDASTVFSNLNFPVGDNRADGITVPLSPAGKVDIVYVAGAGRTAQLLLDITGFYR